MVVLNPKLKILCRSELYLYLKKKIKKNTLILIIESNLEIKNLKNKIILLKQNENTFTKSFKIA